MIADQAQKSHMLTLDWYKKQKGDKVPALCKLLNDWYTFLGDENDLFIYNGKIYEKMDEDDFAKMFQSFYELVWSDYSPKQSSQAFKQLRQQFNKKEFNKPNYLVPFENGLFNTKTKTLDPFDHIYEFTNNIPFNYTLDKAPLFNYAMLTTLPNESDRMKVLQYMRYTLTPSISYQFAQIWFGDGENGKTALAEFIYEILGSLSTTFDLDLLGSDKGYITTLKNIQFGLCSEIGGNYLNSHAQERLKRIIGDRYLDGRGAYRRPEKWVNTTKLIITSNKLPRVQNSGDKAFWRRWQIINFNECFTGKADRELYADIYKYEAGAVLSMLLREIDYTVIKADDWKDVKKFWMEVSSTVRQYIKEECTLDNKVNTDTSDLYNDYMEWCNEKEIEPIAKQTFNSELRRMGINVYKAANNIYFYKGVKITMEVY